MTSLGISYKQPIKLDILDFLHFHIDHEARIRRPASDNPNATKARGFYGNEFELASRQ